MVSALDSGSCVRVRALAWVIVLCSWERHCTLAVPLSTQEYKWVMATKCGGVTCDGLASHPGGVAILRVVSCYGNRDKLRQCGPVWPECGFTFTSLLIGRESEVAAL